MGHLFIRVGTRVFRVRAAAKMVAVLEALRARGVSSTKVLRFVDPVDKWEELPC